MKTKATDLKPVKQKHFFVKAGNTMGNFCALRAGRPFYFDAQNAKNLTCEICRRGVKKYENKRN